jgi:integrase
VSAHSRVAYLLPEPWETALTAWRAWLRVGGLAQKSIDLRYAHVRIVARRSGTAGPADLTLGEVVRVCAEAAWSNEYRRGIRTSLVAFFDWCIANGLADANPATVLPIIPNDKPKPRPTPDDVWRELVANAAPRELLMIRLAGEAGLRRGEVAQCHRDDFNDDPRGASLIVHGKGNKQRVVPLSDSLAQAIRDYCPQGWFFPKPNGGHLTENWIGAIISDLMPPGFTMHTLRHRFATRAYRGSRNLRAVQVLLGHASIATTERYTAVDNDEIRAAMEAAGT